MLIAQVILGFASAADAGSTITALHSLQLQHLDHMLSCRHANALSRISIRVTYNQPTVHRPLVLCWE